MLGENSWRLPRLSTRVRCVTKNACAMKGAIRHGPYPEIILYIKKNSTTHPHLKDCTVFTLLPLFLEFSDNQEKKLKRRNKCNLCTVPSSGKRRAGEKFPLGWAVAFSFVLLTTWTPGAHRQERRRHPPFFQLVMRSGGTTSPLACPRLSWHCCEAYSRIIQVSLGALWDFLLLGSETRVAPASGGGPRGIMNGTQQDPYSEKARGRNILSTTDLGGSLDWAPWDFTSE